MSTLNGSNPTIRLEMPPSSTLSDLMNQIRTWLDSRKIEPSLFKIDHSDQGKVVLEIGFPTPDIAATFRQDFADGLPV
jgi:hypothetical protein